MSISSTVVQRAQIQFHEACGELRPFVGCFWILTAEPGATIRVVPDGSSAISTEVADAQTPEWCLRGPLLQPVERRFGAPAIVVGIRLRPGVAFLLTGAPAHTIVGCRLELNGLTAFDDLTRVAPRPRTPEQHVDVLQRFLVQRLPHASLPPAVATALDAIERAHGCVGVEEVAARCRVSARHLNRLMRRCVGFGAKRYATVIRFQSTLHEMERRPAAAPASLAADHGYFDQSHLTLDVARFSGATPGRLAAAGVSDFSKTRCDDLP